MEQKMETAKRWMGGFCQCVRIIHKVPKISQQYTVKLLHNYKDKIDNEKNTYKSNYSMQWKSQQDESNVKNIFNLFFIIPKIK